MNRTTVSVLCAVYDTAPYLRAALASALAQTRPADEIIVIDDGSHDASPEIAEAMPGVRTIRESHRGIAETRNILVTHATGDLIAWLDADDLFTPDKLQVQVDFMDQHPDIGFTFSHQRLFFESAVPQPYWVRDEMMQGDSPAVATCSMVMRRHLFERVGAFDRSKTPSDDTDWIFRATQAGIKHVTVPETLLMRRVHAANISTTMPMDKARMLGMLRQAVKRARGSAEPT